MGDVNHEPSMEEILASIKRIIAEDGEGVLAPRRARETHDNAPDGVAEDEQVLELTEPFEPEPSPEAQAEAEAESAGDAPSSPEPFDAVQLARAQPAAPLVSPIAEDASRRSLAALAAAAIAPEVDDAANWIDGSKSLEALAREMLRPMLREWLDANLPTLVERIVAGEIERIAATRGQ